MTTWFGKRATKRPLKVNVFAHMMTHQGMLEQLPLFPYFGPGDIVPTGALSLTLPETPRVHFYHYNDIPEVILTIAGVLIMLIEPVLPESTNRKSLGWLAVVAVLGALAASLYQYQLPPGTAFFGYVQTPTASSATVHPAKFRLSWVG